MNDIIYANFAQLSYFDWHNLSEEKIIDFGLGNKGIKTILDDKDAFNLIKTVVYSEWDHGNNEYYLRLSEEGHKIYAKEDLRVFMLWSENREKPDENPKFSELNEWEFLCGYDHQKVLNEAGRIIGDENSGFQGSAFKNGNKVVIAYRGTDEKSDWVNTNLQLGMNKYVDQLTCVAYIYDKVRELEPNSEIHITGHSLGGALAQFAFIYSGCKHMTITWNGLGIGRADKVFDIKTRDGASLRTLKKVLKNQGYIDEENNYLLKCKKANSEEIYEEYLRNILEERKDIGEDFKDEIEYKLYVLYNFQQNYKIFEKDMNKALWLNNFYIEDDLTPNLQSRKGLILKSDNEFMGLELDNDGVGIFRKIKSIFSKSVSRYHSITTFIPFMDDKGTILQGQFNKAYMVNAIKKLINSEKDTFDLVEAKIKIKEKLTIPEKIIEEISDERNTDRRKRRNKIRVAYFDEIFFDIKAQLNKFENDWYFSDDKYMYVGLFSNIEEIAGVIYGDLIKVKLMKEVLREMKDELDVPTYNFFSKYEEKYWLHEKFAPFKYAKLILDPNNKPISERYKIVFVWDLAYKLFITEANEIGKITIKDDIEARTTNLNQIKDEFEKAIKGYTKESYEAETTETKAVWTKLGNMDSLLNKLKKQEQPELIKYIESYRETKEQRKEANKKEAEAYEAEQKAMEKQEIKNREKENVKRKAEEHRIRLAEVEAERRGKGWKIANKEDGWGYM